MSFKATSIIIIDALDDSIQVIIIGDSQKLLTLPEGIEKFVVVGACKEEAIEKGLVFIAYGTCHSHYIYGTQATKDALVEIDSDGYMRLTSLIIIDNTNRVHIDKVKPNQWEFPHIVTKRDSHGEPSAYFTYMKSGRVTFVNDDPSIEMKWQEPQLKSLNYRGMPILSKITIVIVRVNSAFTMPNGTAHMYECIQNLAFVFEKIAITKLQLAILEYDKKVIEDAWELTRKKVTKITDERQYIHSRKRTAEQMLSE